MIYKIDKLDPKNRFLRATRAIKAGETIMEQLPLVAFSLSFQRNLICQHCFSVAKEGNFSIKTHIASVAAAVQRLTAAKAVKNPIGGCISTNVAFSRI
jgi:hypothetical protein